MIFLIPMLPFFGPRRRGGLQPKDGRRATGPTGQDEILENHRCLRGSVWRFSDENQTSPDMAVAVSSGA
ncbi:hypothetical protein, partial [Mesorhizobium sp. M7A.F.Ca.US.007.01.2.1]|uniref:hypothetical protein n=1 Tax=Mesorhizobium sp. M7A.F.Ca.US.007.01.2.1 TaxID=2496711 RepID=UPI0019D2BBE1